jgi:uncharacterized protein
MTEAIEVHHDADARRFSAHFDGADCELDYELRNGVLTILHTGVPPEVGGRGIAGKLTEAALEFARNSGLKVRPACSYAAVYFRRHPEQADLLA